VVDIVTVTLNPAIDRNVELERMAPEKKLRCDKSRRDPGGGGLNVSRALRAMGHDSLALWTRGGHLGDLLQTLLDDQQLQHKPIPIADQTRENVTAYERSSGQQYRLGMPGPNVTADEAQSVMDALQNIDSPDYVVASGSLPAGVDSDFYARMAEQIRNTRTRFILDCSGESLRQALDAGVFLIKPNLRELSDLVERDLNDDDEIADAARELIERGACEYMVVSLGAGGALVVDRNSRTHLTSPTVRIRSKIGAGDSTVAGIVAGLVRGWSITDAARHGVAAGAAAVMTPGTELCRGEDVERLYERMKHPGNQET
jgi:6-phosphofructokinase 2